MGLGAYSIVRYSDDLGDQRINLGVFVWHPIDGYRCRFSSALDRVQAIDPRVALTPLRHQLEEIKDTLISAKPQDRQALDVLCRTYRHGLVVSSNYPAKNVSADETITRLFDHVVSPMPEIRRASSQKNFERSLKKSLELSIESGWPKGKVQQLGIKNMNGIPINLGLRTQIGTAGPAAFWHPISLQSESKPETHLIAAKSTILDMIKTRATEQYKHDRQFVAVLAPRAKAASRLEEVLRSLKSTADQVLVANDNDEVLIARVQEGLRGLETSRRH